MINTNNKYIVDMSKHRELNDAKISFRLAQPQDENLIKSWLDKPHVKNHWDNSSDLLKNLQNYLQGTKDIFGYWLSFYDMQPYALIIDLLRNSLMLRDLKETRNGEPQRT